MNQTQQSLPDQQIRPIYPTYLSEWIDKLPAYDSWEGAIELVDTIRQLWESDNYYPLIYSYPNNIVGTGSGTGSGNVLNFLPGDVQTGVLSIPPYSYLCMMTVYYKSGRDVTSPSGANIRIYEKGSKSDIFYQGVGFYYNIASLNDTTFNNTIPTGPFIFPTPLVVLPPGVLQIEVTNLDSVNAATIQFAFHCAVPKTAINRNIVVQGK